MAIVSELLDKGFEKGRTFFDCSKCGNEIIFVLRNPENPWREKIFYCEVCDDTEIFKYDLFFD